VSRFIICHNRFHDYTIDCIVDGDRANADAIAARMNELRPADDVADEYTVNEFPAVASPADVETVKLYSVAVNTEDGTMTTRTDDLWPWEIKDDERGGAWVYSNVAGAYVTARSTDSGVAREALLAEWSRMARAIMEPEVDG
jgi:hypothetical protein